MERAGSLRARQIKAARALLDWSQEDLAVASHLSIATIRKLELGYISPRDKTVHLIRQALEDTGLEFIEPDGVRHRPDDIAIYQGRDGYMEFYDDVYKTAKNKGGDIIFVSDSEITLGYLGLEEYQRNYAERMTMLKEKSNVRCILTENSTPLWTADYIQFRLLSKHYVNSIPFYVYDDKYAAMIFEADPSPKIIVIRSPVMSRAFRQQFESMWDKATPLNPFAEIEVMAHRRVARG